MSVMDLNYLFSHKNNFLLPKSTQAIQKLGKRIQLPTISPRERTLIIMKPKAFKHSQKYLNSGDVTQRSKSKEFQRLKELFERSLVKDSSENSSALPSINRTPLRDTKIEKQSKPIKEKIMITSFRRFQGSKLVNKNRSPRVPKEESENLLSIVSSRRLSGNPEKKELMHPSESDEDKLLFDESIKYD